MPHFWQVLNREEILQFEVEILPHTPPPPLPPDKSSKTFRKSEVDKSNTCMYQLTVVFRTSAPRNLIVHSSLDGSEGSIVNSHHLHAQTWSATLLSENFKYERPRVVTCVLPDSLRPDVFVESGIDTYIRSSHHLLRELADFLDGTGSSPLKAPVRVRKQIDPHLMTGY